MLQAIKRAASIIAFLAPIYSGGCSPHMYKPWMSVYSGDYRRELAKNTSLINSDKENLRQESYDESAERVNRLEAMLYDSSDFKKKCYTLGDSSVGFFTSEDKKEIKYFRWHAKNKPKEVLVYANGLESHSGWFSETARELVKQGIEVYALDRRGSGLNARLSGTYEEWASDIHELILLAKKQHPDADMNLVSLCFGARVTTTEAIKNPKDAETMIYISPGFDMKVDISLLGKFLAGLSNITGISVPIKSPIEDDRMFTSNLGYLDFINKDLLRVIAPNSRDFFQGYLAGEFSRKNLGSINLPVLVFLAGKDRIVDIEKSRKTFTYFGRKPEIVEYPDSEHTIFFGEDKEKFVNELVNFVERN